MKVVLGAQWLNDYLNLPTNIHLYEYHHLKHILKQYLGFRNISEVTSQLQWHRIDTASELTARPHLKIAYSGILALVQEDVGGGPLLRHALLPVLVLRIRCLELAGMLRDVPVQIVQVAGA